MWEANYQTPDPNDWHGRDDGVADLYFHQTIRFLNLHESLPKLAFHPSFALIGFAADEGVRRNQGRVGAKEGPRAIRQAFARLPCHTGSATCYDAGTIHCEDGDLERAQAALVHTLDKLLQHGFITIVLGGGHELAFAHYQGIKRSQKFDDLAIVNFDAHYDMRPLLEGNLASSGTGFLQMAKDANDHAKEFDYTCIGVQPIGNHRELMQTAKRYGVQSIFAEELHRDLTLATNAIDKILKRRRHVYTSICMDVFAAPFAPGVSAPQVFGLVPWQVQQLVKQLANSSKVIAYDLAELSPPYDVDGRTAKLAAGLLHTIVHHHQ